LEDWKSRELDSTNIAYHIRQTDNEKAIRLSPFDLFLNSIMIQEKPVVVFSDEAGVVRALRDRLGPEKILAFERLRQRNTVEGMVEGAAVFFALAGKSRIFGSANSSFSEVASEYGGVELVLLRQD
jgi:hypothetical protein